MTRVQEFRRDSATADLVPIPGGMVRHRSEISAGDAMAPYGVDATWRIVERGPTTYATSPDKLRVIEATRVQTHQIESITIGGVTFGAECFGDVGMIPGEPEGDAIEGAVRDFNSWCRGLAAGGLIQADPVDVAVRPAASGNPRDLDVSLTVQLAGSLVAPVQHRYVGTYEQWDWTRATFVPTGQVETCEADSPAAAENLLRPDDWVVSLQSGRWQSLLVTPDDPVRRIRVVRAE
jgi:hypothetical protein